MPDTFDTTDRHGDDVTITTVEGILGYKNDSPAPTDTSVAGVVALFKRLLQKMTALDATLSALDVLGALTDTSTVHTIPGLLLRLQEQLPADLEADGSLKVKTGHSISTQDHYDLERVGGALIALGQAVAASSLPVVLPAAQITALTPPAAISGFATETTMAAVNTKTPALGQAVAASSTPVVLPAAQVTSLTPPPAITGYATEATMASIDGKTPAKGAATAANSTPVTLATDGVAATLLGGVTETAPTTDTASSGQNGRLQRIAQRVSSLIGVLPASLGPKAKASSLSTAFSSDQVGTSGSPASDVLTMQGIAGAYPVTHKVVARTRTSTDVNVPASNTAAVITYTAAGSGVSNVLAGLAWSYSALPTGGNIKIEDGAGGTVLFSLDITAAGPGYIPFLEPQKGATNTALVITLAAGGVGVSGKVNGLGARQE